MHAIVVAAAKGIAETRNIRLVREDQKLYECTTHGTFVKQYLHGATPETIAEIPELAAGLRE